MKSDRLIPALAALSGAVAVIAGAFATHGATGISAGWLKTGSHYQLIHAVAAIAVLAKAKGSSVALCFVIGGAVFAGSLYLMAMGGPRWLGAVTPFGGFLLILGWLLLAMQLLRR